MINKVYEKITKIIKTNYKEIIVLLFLFIIINFPVNCTIMVSGGTININDRIQIENSYNSRGNFNLAYVSEIKGTIPTYLLSYIIPTWTKVDLEEYKASSNETSEDIEKRAKTYLEYSVQSAVKTAYDKAGKNFNYTDYKFYVVYVDDAADKNIKVGDIILKVNGHNMKTLTEYKKNIESSNIGEKIGLTVLRNGEQKNIDVEVKNIDGKKLTGVSILQLYNYNTNPKIKLNFKNNESGSSGGLMLTLAIYDKLIQEDITKGLKIVGTGTIDFEGNVGEIDGVEYKLKGAVKSKADVFIVPLGNNYNDCIKLKEKKGYKIKIIGVSTFDDALTKLNNLK